MQEKSNTEKRHIADSKDVTAEDWSEPMADKYGLKATTRYGLGIRGSFCGFYLRFMIVP